jgi:hypothetical protein
MPGFYYYPGNGGNRYGSGITGRGYNNIYNLVSFKSLPAPRPTNTTAHAGGTSTPTRGVFSGNSGYFGPSSTASSGVTSAPVSHGGGGASAGGHH